MIRTGILSDSDCKRTAKELALARKVEAELEASRVAAEKNRLEQEAKWAKERRAETVARQKEALKKEALQKKIARDRLEELDQKKLAEAKALGCKCIGVRSPFGGAGFSDCASRSSKNKGKRWCYVSRINGCQDSKVSQCNKSNPKCKDWNYSWSYQACKGVRD